ncbi:MAG: SDR family oxidoreductase [Clostridiales bacterium]|nr:SDR family oxidoreductase [Clostridiales bacterium]
MGLEGKLAIVTGASSGIGRAVALRLSSEGCDVIGFGRSFKEDLPFRTVELDLTDTPRVLMEMRDIPPADILVNCAGCAYYGVHGSISSDEISEMVRVDLELPMLLCRQFLPGLREKGGIIINIASVTATRINTHAAAYGAVKAGLRSFGRSLFEEERKNGVRVLTVCPDLTDTALYRNADFEPDPRYCLDAATVADSIINAVKMPEGSLVTELEIRPQFNRIVKKDNG